MTNISKVTLNAANECPLPLWCATDPLLGQEVGGKCAVEHENIVRKAPSGWSPYVFGWKPNNCVLITPSNFYILRRINPLSLLNWWLHEYIHYFKFSRMNNDNIPLSHTCNPAKRHAHKLKTHTHKKKQLVERGPEATAKLFTPESEVDILENLIGRTLPLISQK